MNNSGCFVVSLDFEMMWGCHDWATVDGYGRSNVKQVRVVIDRLVDLFDRYNIHATVAFVGLLLNKTVKEVVDNSPQKDPSYSNRLLNPLRNEYLERISINDYDLYFANDVVTRLKQHKAIELASHTYSHYYCWAKGQSLDEFRADITQMNRIANDNGIALSTIVFPKNEVSEDYLHLCSEMGFTAYRGNPTHLFGKGGFVKSHLNRILRFVDSYLPISKNTVPLSDITTTGGMVNVQASRFLRPFNSKLAFMDSFKLIRIKCEMRRAAKKGELYHLWWHPHNFGADLDKNIEFLSRVLETYKYCKDRYGMKSFSIKEFTNYWKQIV